MTHPYTRPFAARWPHGTRATIDLTYDPAYPLAVELTLNADVTWVFARDLIAAGLDATPDHPAGVDGGDVHVWSDPPYVPVSNFDSDGPRLYIRLSSPYGSTEFSLRRQRVAGFIAATAVMVPFGTEQSVVDIDAELLLLIQQEGSL